MKASLTELLNANHADSLVLCFIEQYVKRTQTHVLKLSRLHENAAYKSANFEALDSKFLLEVVHLRSQSIQLDQMHFLLHKRCFDIRMRALKCMREYERLRRRLLRLEKAFFSRLFGQRIRKQRNRMMLFLELRTPQLQSWLRLQSLLHYDTITQFQAFLLPYQLSETALESKLTVTQDQPIIEDAQFPPGLVELLPYQ